MSEFLKNISTVFQQGGPVLFVLLGVSIISVTMSFERCVFWWRLHKPGRRAWVARALDRLKRGDAAGAGALAALDTTLYGTIVEELTRVRLTDSTAVGLVEERRHHIERFNGALSTIVTAAPLIGLLGTVTGIIRSFDVIGNASAVRDIPGVAQGVSEALLNTAGGLGVALFTLIPYVICKSQSDRLLSNIEALCSAAHQGRAAADAGAGGAGAAPRPPTAG